VQILVTRPGLEAERTAAVLSRQGYEPLLAPMLKVVAVDAPIGSGPWAGLVLTSGNAARSLADHPMRNELQSLRVFTVGKRTERAVRALGFKTVISVGGDSEDLVRVITARASANADPYLYLAGNDRARDLQGDLAQHGIAMQTVVIYRADAADALPEDVAQALAQRRIAGILHYSRRTAAIFCECVERAGLIEPAKDVPHYALSERVGEPLVAMGVRDVQSAETPDEAALLRLLPPA
jgi:uroporphyrinogen-III synthase